MNKKGGEEDMKNEELGEANAVMFTNYKRADGFEVSFTLRNGSGADLMKKFDKAIQSIKAEGGTPISMRSGGFPKKEARPVEYAGGVCPEDSGKLVYAYKKDGTKFIKCENNKFVNGQQTGCRYIQWSLSTQNQTTEYPERQMSEY